MLDIWSYITWFVDGEWCFSVSFTQRQSLHTGIEVRPSFSVSQKKYSLWVLKKIQEYFACGWIRRSEKDGTYKYEVRSIQDLYSKILPHFKWYPLITDKRNDFNSFDTICQLIHSNKHLSIDWINQIIDLAFTMNKSWKRKYPKKDLLRIVNKMKV